MSDTSAPTPETKDTEALPKLPAQIEEALTYKLRRYAQKRCRNTLDAYAECTKGKLFSIPRACKEPLDAMNECLKSYNNQENMNILRRKFLNGDFTEDQLKRDLYEARKQARGQKGDYL